MSKRMMKQRIMMGILLTLLASAFIISSIPSEGLVDSPKQEGVIYTEPKDIGRPNRWAVIEVDGWGTIKIELYENMTPITTKNFIDLAQSGFYDGISFHRVIDDFVAQTGDPNTKNMNPYDDGMGGSGKTIPLEICENASHVDGAVGMARSSEPDSASSQFYICDGPQHGLDDWNRDGYGYAVFGIVVEGLDVAKAIAAAETYGMRRPLLQDHPVENIVMSAVYVMDPPVDDNDTLEKEDEGGSRDAPFPAIGAVASAMLIMAVIGKKLRK
jgi:peptidyl-prolyl cis-trans isomerase B (cyclophilin B)